MCNITAAALREGLVRWTTNNQGGLHFPLRCTTNFQWIAALAMGKEPIITGQCHFDSGAWRFDPIRYAESLLSTNHKLNTGGDQTFVSSLAGQVVSLVCAVILLA